MTRTSTLLPMTTPTPLVTGRGFAMDVDRHVVCPRLASHQALDHDVAAFELTDGRVDQSVLLDGVPEPPAPRDGTSLLGNCDPVHNRSSVEASLQERGCDERRAPRSGGPCPHHATARR